MITSIHQPHFLPWMGYFNKIINSDVFVILNTVQYRPRYYQNRCKVKQGDAWRWISIPVHSERITKIMNVTLVQDDWREHVQKSIEFEYGKTPYFRQYWTPICDAILKPAESLDDLNYNTLLVLLDLLGVKHVQVVRASEIPADSDDPTDRLVSLCNYFGTTCYISGRGGRDYMRIEAFEEAGIQIVYQDLDFNNVVYQQKGKTFVPGLSIVDAIFNIGPVETRQLCEQAWKLSASDHV
jgi:hypothetical protein